MVDKSIVIPSSSSHCWIFSVFSLMSSSAPWKALYIISALSAKNSTATLTFSKYEAISSIFAACSATPSCSNASSDKLAFASCTLVFNAPKSFAGPLLKFAAPDCSESYTT